MIRRPPRSTRTATLFSYTTLFRSTDSMTVLITATGFAPWRQTILPQGDSIRLAIILEKATNKLETVIITAGSFVASDEKRGAELSALDIVSTAGADGDITGAFRTLPGTQQVRSEERRVGKEGFSPCRSRWTPYP